MNSPADTPVPRRLIRALPELSGPVRVAPLPGGLTNRSFLLEGQFGQWVLRLNGTAPGVDRQREAQVLDALREADLGPEIIRNDPQAGHLLYEFLPGVAWTRERARSSDGQRALGRWLRRLHALPADVPTVDACGALAGYLDDLSAPLAEPLRTRFEGIVDAIGEPTERVLCHLDLVSGNLIGTGQALRAIDWEYAGLAPPELDLAFYLVYQELSLSEAAEFLRAYGGDQAETWQARVQPYLVLATLLDEAWRALMR